MFVIKKIENKTLTNRVYSEPVSFDTDKEMFNYLVSNIDLFDGYGSDVFNNKKSICRTKSTLPLLESGFY